MSVYAPTEIHDILKSAGLPAAHDPLQTMPVRPAVQELVAKVARLFERANIVSFENDIERRRLMRDPAWQQVYGAFLDADLFHEELRHMSGKAQTFVRMSVRPADLMAGLNPSAAADPRIVAFWQTVADPSQQVV